VLRETSNLSEVRFGDVAVLKPLVEKRLLVAHQFGLCVAHMGCATIATPLVKNYQWRISISATHNLPMRGAICATSSLKKIKKKFEKKTFFLKIIKIEIM
jgi:hypothetical protein